MVVKCPEITKHSIKKLNQRFRLKDKKKAKGEIRKALEEGEAIDIKDKFNYVLHYKDYYLIVSGGVIKTAITEEMYNEKKEY